MEQDWIYRFDRFFLDLKNRVLVKDRDPIHLTLKVFDVLLQLVQARGQAVSKDELLEKAWPYSNVTESNIFHTISLLRKALARDNGDRLDHYIANVSGTGYKFAARVTRIRRNECWLGTANGRDLIRKRKPAKSAAADAGGADPWARSRMRRSSLPAQPTPLIGRESEVAHIKSLVRRDYPRLITLTGAGGSGKTRVAIQAAQELKDDFLDIVCFISLGHVMDADLVAPTIAQALGIRDDSSRNTNSQPSMYNVQPSVEAIKRRLGNKHALLVVDNFEQVIAAAGLLADLLCCCPRLKMLVTSRMPLNVRAEQPFVINPLAVPGGKKRKTIAGLIEYPSVALLVERAKSSIPHFELTAENAEPVAGICRRLDGLPLAIELVAQRLRLLSPQALLAGLESGMDSIGYGPRDLPARQQTMRKTIEWSYNLLGEEEKILFRRLSVFVGGFTAEAAIDVCFEVNGRTVDVAAGLSSLVGKYMVCRGQNPKLPNEARFDLLETTREFASEALSANGEKDEIQLKHLEVMCKLVEDTEARLLGAEIVGALDLLESEIGNVRAALGFAWHTQTPRMGLRICGALRKFWITRGFRMEGASWLTQFLGVELDLGDPITGKALAAAGAIANEQGECDKAFDLFERARCVYAKAGCKIGVADALGFAGVSLSRRGRFREAEELLTRAIDHARDASNSRLIALFLIALGTVAHSFGDDSRSLRLNKEAADVLAAAQDTWGLSFALNNIGLLEANSGNLDEGKRRLRDSLLLSADIGGENNMIDTLESFADRKGGAKLSPLCDIAGSS